MYISVGQVIKLSYNQAKSCGDDLLAYEDVTVEAVGFDWIVVSSVDCPDRYASYFGNLKEWLEEELWVIGDGCLGRTQFGQLTLNTEKVS